MCNALILPHHLTKRRGLGSINESHYVSTFWVSYCDVRYDFRIKRCSVRLYLQLSVGWIMSYLRYLCFFAHSGVQHMFCCVFLCFSWSCVPYVCSMDCPFWIDPSVFSSVYLLAPSPFIKMPVSRQQRWYCSDDEVLSLVFSFCSIHWYSSG